MANETLTQLHPGIISTISNETVTYSTSSGVVTMFVADVFESGLDNKTQLVTTVDEFLFKYGEPNMAKYGQGAYNVVNWLQSGGEAYVLRVMPDDASYSHSILNIQTKVVENGKSVLDNVSSEIKQIDDVYIRPVNTNITLNNNSESSIKNELTLERPDKTIDGYSNNFILAFYPEGRGSFYDKYGVRISLNSSYDSFANFRLYNLEIVQYDDNDNISIVDGPILFSFSPDALSESNESLYIETVMEKYSRVLKCKFNLDNYLKVANLINPDVNPYIIDILTGSTREINDTNETYYNSVTEGLEDIHLSLHKYGIDGEPLMVSNENVMNISDSDDEVENQIIKLDNNFRDSDHTNNEKILEDMTDYFKTLGTSSISTSINLIYNKEGEANPIGTIPDLYSKLDPDSDEATTNLFNTYKEKAINYYNAKNKYGENSTTTLETAYTELKNSTSSIISGGIIPFLDDIYKVIAFYKLVVNEDESTASDFLALLENITGLNSIKTQCEKIDVVITSSRSGIIDLKDNIRNCQLGYTVNDSTLEDLNYISTLVSEKLSTILTNIINPMYEDEDTLIDSIKNSISILYSGEYGNEDNFLQFGLVNVLNNFNTGLLINSATNRDKFYGMCSSIIGLLDDLLVIAAGKNTINKIANLIPTTVADTTTIVVDLSVDSILSYLKVIYSSINTIKTAAVSMGDTSNSDELNDLIQLATFNINSTKSTISSISSNVFNNNLQNFQSVIKFSNGSDGSFTYSEGNNNSERTKDINTALIKAYKGTLDLDIINSDIITFQHILDANYSPNVKAAIVTLCKDIRQDCLFWADTCFQSSPEDTLDWRKSIFNTYTKYMAIYSQNLTYDDEYTKKSIKVTPTYVLASKIPSIAATYGLQYPIAGPRRGLIDGFNSLSWVPNNSYKERLYTKKINYIEQDTKKTQFGSQSTSDTSNTPLSSINNMLILFDIKKNAESIVADYQFEFSDSDTTSALTYSLSSFLNQYVTNKSCESISCNVYASDYNKLQKTLCVQISIKFNNTIEKIVINLDVLQ